MRLTYFIFISLVLTGLGSAQVIEAQRKVQVVPIPGLESMTEQELIERMLSDTLMQSEEQKTRTLRLQMDVIVGDLQRVVELSSEKLKILSIAAKAAINETLTGWRSAQENQVRQLAQGANAEALPTRLSGMGEMQMGNESPHTRPIWTSTLSRVLSAEESQRWKNVEAERAEYRHAAIAALLMAELEKKMNLSTEQMDQLEPHVKTAFRDYLPDMTSYMDRGGGMDIRMLSLLVNAVPETIQSSILSADQITQWKTLTADFSGWWQSIQQNHARRLAVPTK